MGIIIIYNMFKAALALAAVAAATSGPTSDRTSMYYYRYYRRSYSYRYRYYRPYYVRRSYYRYRYSYRSHSSWNSPRAILRKLKYSWAGRNPDFPKAKDFWDDVVSQIPNELHKGAKSFEKAAAR